MAIHRSNCICKIINYNKSYYGWTFICWRHPSALSQLILTTILWLISIVISTFQMRESRPREVRSQRSHSQEVVNLGSEEKSASLKVHDPQHQGRLAFERGKWKNKYLLFLSRQLLPCNHGNKTMEGTTWHERCGIPAPEHVLLTEVSFLRHRKASSQCVSTAPSAASEGYHRGPVQSLLQDDRRSLLPVVEDWNLSHGMRFYWDSFLITPNNSTVGR